MAPREKAFETTMILIKKLITPEQKNYMSNYLIFIVTP